MVYWVLELVSAWLALLRSATSSYVAGASARSVNSITGTNNWFLDYGRLSACNISVYGKKKAPSSSAVKDNSSKPWQDMNSSSIYSTLLRATRLLCNVRVRIVSIVQPLGSYFLILNGMYLFLYSNKPITPITFSVLLFFTIKLSALSRHIVIEFHNCKLKRYNGFIRFQKITINYLQSPSGKFYQYNMLPACWRSWISNMKYRGLLKLKPACQTMTRNDRALYDVYWCLGYL